MVEKEKQEILLESGTNELEILEFRVHDRYYGINVAKIVEILRYEEITPMANANPFVKGVFKPRDEIITVIDLASYLGLTNSDDTERDILIITKFNNQTNAFHVHSVEEIHRISWTDIEKPSGTIQGGEEGVATGIARLKDRLIAILDFEKIIVEINPSQAINLQELDSLGHRTENGKPIVLAEDSPLLARMILEALEKSGYNNIISCSNGKDAWDKLNEMKAKGKPILEQVGCVITDIEMPLMDGHHLLKNIKDDNILKEIPVIIFSSLIDGQMMIKGEQLGVTAQVSKPEIGELIKLIDTHIAK